MRGRSACQRDACGREADRVLHPSLPLFRLWWADPLAGVIIVPIVAKEGVKSLRGGACEAAGGRTPPDNEHEPYSVPR